MHLFEFFKHGIINVSSGDLDYSQSIAVIVVEAIFLILSVLKIFKSKRGKD